MTSPNEYTIENFMSAFMDAFSTGTGQHANDTVLHSDKSKGKDENKDENDRNAALPEVREVSDSRHLAKTLDMDAAQDKDPSDVTLFSIYTMSQKQQKHKPCNASATQDDAVKFRSVFTDCIAEKSSFILDLSYLLYYGHYRSGEQPWTDTKFVVDVVSSILSRGHEVYIAVDGKPVRKQKDKNYKANREHSYNIRENMPPLLFNLDMCRHVHVHYNPELEADDVIFTLNALLDGKKVIVSSDNDMLQCLGSDTVIDTGKALIDAVSYVPHFESKFHGVPVDKLPMYRAIVGDASDNIRPAVARFPHALAARIVKALDIPVMSFPERNVMCIEMARFMENAKATASETRWIERLMSDTIAEKDEHKTKARAKKNTTEGSKETITQEDLALIPDDLHSSLGNVPSIKRLSSITAARKVASGNENEAETDEDSTADEPQRSAFQAWHDNFDLMRLHPYTMEEISCRPVMEYGDMPSEIMNALARLRKLDYMML